MENDAQRIAILQVMGWKDLKRSNSESALRGTDPEGEKNQIAPNPLVNLNVMNMAEDFLNKFDNNLSSNLRDYASVRYSGELGKILGVQYKEVQILPEMADKGFPVMTTSIFASPFEQLKFLRATAAQKAEAFLKALHLWVYPNQIEFTTEETCGVAVLDPTAKIKATYIQ